MPPSVDPQSILSFTEESRTYPDHYEAMSDNRRASSPSKVPIPPGDGPDRHHSGSSHTLDQAGRAADAAKRIEETLNMELDNRHRDTLERILRHPASGNIEWRQVTSLLEAVGAVTEERDGNLEVSLGGETEVLHRPHGKDVDEQMIVDLRRMLTRAGFTAADR
jgi:hypothetical protein